MAIIHKKGIFQNYNLQLHLEFCRLPKIHPFRAWNHVYLLEVNLAGLCWQINLDIIQEQENINKGVILPIQKCPKFPALVLWPAWLCQRESKPHVLFRKNKNPKLTQRKLVLSRVKFFKKGILQLRETYHCDQLPLPSWCGQQSQPLSAHPAWLLHPKGETKDSSVHSSRLGTSE